MWQQWIYGHEQQSVSDSIDNAFQFIIFLPFLKLDFSQGSVYYEPFSLHGYI